MQYLKIKYGHIFEGQLLSYLTNLQWILQPMLRLDLNICGGHFIQCKQQPALFTLLPCAHQSVQQSV